MPNTATPTKLPSVPTTLALTQSSTTTATSPKPNENGMPLFPYLFHLGSICVNALPVASTILPSSKISNHVYAKNQVLIFYH